MAPAPGRQLSRPELRDLATKIATDERRWRHLVRHVPERRTYEELLLEDELTGAAVGVWLICWMDDHDTGFHDHDTSSGAVAVAAGVLREDRLAIGGRPHSRTYTQGEGFDFSSSDIHRMSHPGGAPAISIHAYSPPLERMGAYAIDPDGVIRRTAISYEQELRPLDAMPG